VGVRHVEFVLPAVPDDRLPSVFRSLGVAFAKRKTRRALAIMSKEQPTARLDAADAGAVAAALTLAGCAKGFRLALLASDECGYRFLCRIAEVAEQSGLRVMAFSLYDEAMRWLVR
jgi:hypothetical protein